MIISFGSQATEDLFNGINSKKASKIPSEIVKTALRKLDMLNAAQKLDDLRVPPGNRLEALQGDLEDWYNIRINEQWRIIFQWQAGAITGVEIVDYHR
ncbi:MULTISPECIES: type II toxin-antitoxin system RelE/ParE family toxin [Spirulina sp. CCY15215]|uniref:type II toxin-antitoxin system RelE/ParE family toxin n=1 Tax=Spirulina sp. CCY15215 TaxID=2767591 RepID=UPI00194F28B1|nr:type II toxin-antitoxin system RelE/ParE family toxin [Spirulina major]